MGATLGSLMVIVTLFPPIRSLGLMDRKLGYGTNTVTLVLAVFPPKLADKSTRRSLSTPSTGISNVVAVLPGRIFADVTVPREGSDEEMSSVTPLLPAGALNSNAAFKVFPA